MAEAKAADSLVGGTNTRDPFDVSSVDVEAVECLLSRRLEYRRKRMFDRADAARDSLLERYGVRVNDKDRTWSASERRSGGRVMKTKEYQFRGKGVEDLDDDDLRNVQDMITRRNAAKLSKDYGTADTIRDELFRKFSIRVDDQKRNWYFDWSVSRPKKSFTSETKSNLVDNSNDGSPWNDDSIPWGDSDEDDLDPNNYDEILDIPAPDYQVAKSYKKAHNSLEVDKDEEEYIVQRITERIEATTDRDFDTASAIQTELLLCYNVTLRDELGLWSKGDDFSVVPSKENVDLMDSALSFSDIDDEKSLKELTVPVLKEKLRERGLKVSGRKAELIERLLSSE